MGLIYSVTHSPDGRVLASASGDETTKLWDALTMGLLHSLPVPVPYQGMNIAINTGLTEVQPSRSASQGRMDSVSAVDNTTLDYAS